MKLPLSLLFVLVTSTSLVRGEAPGSEAFNVRIEVQMVTMPLKDGLPLLPNLRDAGSIDGAFSQIQKMIEAGDATLVGWPQIVMKSGQRAVVEDVQEVLYATSYEPGRAEASKGKSKEGAAAVAATGGAPVPTVFETRNAGSTLEVEPVVGPDGKKIDLNLVPQHVRLLEFEVVASGRDANGHDWEIKQPRFFAAKTTTSLAVRAGQRVLLGEFCGPEGSEEILFFILKADLVAVDAGQPR